MAFNSTITPSRPRKLDSAISAPSGTPIRAARNTADRLTSRANLHDREQRRIARQDQLQRGEVVRHRRVFSQSFR